MSLLKIENALGKTLQTSEPVSADIRSAMGVGVDALFGNPTATALLQTEMGGVMLKAIMQAFSGLSSETEQTLKQLPPEAALPFIAVCTEMAGNLTKCVLYLQSEIAKRNN